MSSCDYFTATDSNYFQSKDLYGTKDEASSPSSPLCSSSPTRYDKFKPMPCKVDLRKIEKLRERHESHIIRNNFDLFKLTGFDTGEAAIRAGPVLQVISVTIINERRSLWEDFEIFGEISITDGQDNTFYIYKCEEDEPELVSTEWNRLFLKDWPITPVYTGGKVKFSIRDKESGEMFFEGDFDVDFSINDAYANKQTLKCPGKHGFYALMEYTKIPFAFVAKVSLLMADANKDRARDIGIYGTIKVNDLVLFEEQASEPANMEHGEINRLAQSTHVLAVPIYSSLAGEIKLYSGHSVFADDTFKLLPIGYHPHMLGKDCTDKSCCLLVDVSWFFYEEYFARGNSRLVDNVDVTWNPTRPQRAQLKKRDPPSDEESKRALVEVFSIFVGGESSAPLDLCGKIVVRDIHRNKTVFIFARNSKIPDVLTDGHWRTVSLAWPDRCFVEKDFYMFLNLKDKYGNRVCRGYLNWCPDADMTESRYNRRLCGVIRGADGYFAAVHYSIFKNGKKAKVTVIWTGDYSTFVYGSVYAAYSGSNYKYPSTYDKKYYQSIIFERSPKDYETVEKGREVALSKSHVSAPSNCEGLCLDVNLYYIKPREKTSTRDSRVGLYSHTLKFKADEKKVRRPPEGPFMVKVEWLATVESNCS